MMCKIVNTRKLKLKSAVTEPTCIVQKQLRPSTLLV